MKRRGFTLVELLTVIGVIAVLIGLAFLAYRHVSERARADQGVVSMGLAKNLLSTYVEGGGRIDPVTLYGAGYFPPGQRPPYKVYAPVDTKEGGANRFGREVIATQRIMRACATNAECNRLLRDAPDSLKLYVEYRPGTTYLSGDEVVHERKFYRVTNAATASSAPPAAPWRETPTATPVLLDGHGNILLFVPGDGLAGVTIDGVADYRVVSTYPPIPKVMTDAWKGSRGGAPADPDALVGKPYFVSAGPDGRYEEGTDNAYSFSQ